METILPFSKELDNLSDKTIDFWGAEAQTNMVIEEASELIKAICKWKRYGGLELENAIVDEMADMYITLNTLKRILNVSDRTLDLKVFDKGMRTYERLDKEEEILEDPHY